MENSNPGSLDPPRRRGPGRPRKIRPGDGPKPPMASGAQPATLHKAPPDSIIQNKPDAKSITPQGKELVEYASTNATPSSSKRPSPDSEGFDPPSQRRRTDSSQDVQSHKTRSLILPARRSTRHATVQATQISEGTIRPPGPPHLEAALAIALRNLESDMWRYLWTYYKRNPRGPLPTPADIKAACPQVRRAAEAVDKADRELEDAVDEIMVSNANKKGRIPARSGRVFDKFGVQAASEERRLEGVAEQSSSISTPGNEFGTGDTAPTTSASLTSVDTLQTKDSDGHP